MNRHPRSRLKLTKQTVRPMSPLRDDDLARAAGGTGFFCLRLNTLVCAINSLGQACPTSTSIVYTTCH